MINELLFWSAGVDVKLLNDCSNHTLNLKYKSLGGLVLTPAFFAFPSATYFMLDTLLPKTEWAIYPAIIIGLFWALIILNFDRFLVISFTKSKNVMADLCSFSVILRIAMSLMIGFIIAYPLVLAIFSKNINEHLSNQKYQQRSEIVKQYDDHISNYNEKINALIDKNSKQKSFSLIQDSNIVTDLKDKIRDQQRIVNITQIELTDEIAGNIKSRTQKKGDGLTAASIRIRLNTLHKELQDLKNELQQTRKEQLTHHIVREKRVKKENDNIDLIRKNNRILVKELINDLNTLKNEKKATLKNFDAHVSYDFLTKSNALDTLSKDNFNVLLWKWLLTGLLCLIDLFAILLKVLSEKDSYDDKKDTIKYNYSINQQIEKETYQERHNQLVYFKNQKESIQADCEVFENKIELLTDCMERHQQEKKRFYDHADKLHYDQAIINNFTEISETLFSDFLVKFRATTH